MLKMVCSHGDVKKQKILKHHPRMLSLRIKLPTPVGTVKMCDTSSPNQVKSSGFSWQTVSDRCISLVK